MFDVCRWPSGFLTTVQVGVILLLTACVAHAAPKSEAPDAERVMTEAELQGQVMAFADRYWSMMNSAGIEYIKNRPSPENRRIVRAQLVYSGADAFTIAAGPKPVVAFLDMVVMVTLGRMVFEQHYAKFHGDEVDPIIAGFKKAEADIWEITGNVLTKEQQRKLMGLIEAWRKDHPEVVVFSRVRFSEFEKLRGISDGSGKESAGGLFKSVAKATEQVEATRLLAERGMYLGTRLPLMTGQFANVWASQLTRNPDVNPILADLNRMADVSQRLVVVAEKLPEDMSKERQATIDQLFDLISKERRDTIDHLIQEVARERRKTIEEFVAEERRIRGLLTELKLTLGTGHELLTSTNSLVDKLDLGKSDESTTSMTRPFDIKDYQDTLKEASTTLSQLDDLLKTVDQMDLEKVVPLIAEAAEKVENKGQQWVLQAFILGVILILILLIGAVFSMLLYRYLSQRMLSPQT